MPPKEDPSGRPHRPDYKGHPLWAEAMALAKQAYAVAETLRARDESVAKSVRRAAVGVPAHVANALSADGQRRSDEVLAARGALAELARHASDASPDHGEALRGRADRLARAILFELAGNEGLPS